MCRLASWLVCMLLAITAAGTVAHAAPAVRVASDDSADGTAVAADESPTEGTLYARTNDEAIAGVFPLTHTDVHATVSGFISRVTVTQQFQNTFARKIEAVYVFPLPQSAAVDRMTMHVGGRTITGKIATRDEARETYEAARDEGYAASLLEQERPNVFTQSVANILPGEWIDIEISYVEILPYDDGTYTWVFPMVVAPRYTPPELRQRPDAQASPAAVPEQAPDAKPPRPAGVPDAARIQAPLIPAGVRSGHDVSILVELDTGIPLVDVKSVLHDVAVDRTGASTASVRLADEAVIPNRDFVLKFDVAGRTISDAVLAHADRRSGFFTMILQPPDRVPASDVTPKELVFVLDTSGSMQGFPIEKAKECIRMALDGLYPDDTFNLITFAGETSILFPAPVPATPGNLARAREVLDGASGGGGTEMMTAIRAALEPTDEQDHVRIVCFMTDGEVGNDMEIIGEVQRHPNARVFSFGIGDSVNRFLLEKIATEGRGEAQFVSLADDGSAAARRFYERVRNPLLTDVRIDWGGLAVADVYPSRLPDLFGAEPLVLCGRYDRGGTATVKLSGKSAGRDVTRTIQVTFPDSETGNDVIATLWARMRIDAFMAKDWDGLQRGEPRPEIAAEVTRLGLRYGLVTQFTSFVAVDDSVSRGKDKPQRVDVPLELPEGMVRAAVEGTPAPASIPEPDAVQPVAVAAPEAPAAPADVDKPGVAPGEIGHGPASLGGTVTDQQGAAISEAVLTLTAANGASVDVTADSSGAYSVASLPAGRYTVTVAAAGFQVRSFDIKLGAKRRKLDVSLPVGGTAESVEVLAGESAVQTATLSGVISSRSVRSLPLNGRSSLKLVPLSSSGRGYGVGTGSGGGVGAGSGARSGPGVGWNVGGGTPAFGGGDAPGGGRSAGIVNVVTRSGTNSTHCRIYNPDRDPNGIQRPSREEQELLDKLDTALGLMLGSTAPNSYRAAIVSRYVRGGVVVVELWVDTASPEVLTALRAAGLEFDPAQQSGGRRIVGTIRLDGVRKLAGLESVRYVAAVERAP